MARKQTVWVVFAVIHCHRNGSQTNSMGCVCCHTLPQKWLANKQYGLCLLSYTATEMARKQTVWVVFAVIHCHRNGSQTNSMGCVCCHTLPQKWLANKQYGLCLLSYTATEMARKQRAWVLFTVTHCTQRTCEETACVVFTVTHCPERTCEETACVWCLQAARRWAGWRCKATRRRRLISTARPLSLLKSAVTTQRSVVFAQSFSVKHMHRQVTRSVPGNIMWPWDGMPKEAWTCFCSQPELKNRVKREVVPSSHKDISVVLWPISSVVKSKPTAVPWRTPIWSRKVLLWHKYW